MLSLTSVFLLPVIASFYLCCSLLGQCMCLLSFVWQYLWLSAGISACWFCADTLPCLTCCCLFLSIDIGDVESFDSQCLTAGGSTSCCFCPFAKRKGERNALIHHISLLGGQGSETWGGELLALVWIFKGASRKSTNRRLTCNSSGSGWKWVCNYILLLLNIILSAQPYNVIKILGRTNESLF